MKSKCVTRRLFFFAHFALFALVSLSSSAQPNAPAPAPAPAAASATTSEPQGNLYAVEIKMGSSWDAAKQAHEQLYFREHSANLKRLRDQGSVVLGARYSDKGLIVLRATTTQEARSLMDADPSIQNKIFAYEMYDFNVFYGGAVQPKPRRP